MKVFKLIKLLGIMAIGVFFIANLGVAAPVYYDDIYKNWPGQGVADKFINEDVNGIPDIEGARVTTNDDGGLLKIEILFQDYGRLVRNENEFDSLFINTNWTEGESWDNWDYYIKGYADSATYYDDFVDYTYTKALESNYRTNHVNGLELKGLGDAKNFPGLSGGNQSFVLTYDFTQLDHRYLDYPITLGDKYVIGYTPFCANDVFLTPVPEPSTMLLMGAGLIALAGVGRRKYFKKDKK